MTLTLPTKDSERWALAVIATGMALLGMLYLNVMVLVFSSLPKEVAGPGAGFLTGLLVVLAGALPAPRRHRLRTAWILLLFGTAAAAALSGFHFISTLAGGLAAVAFVGWWFHPRRTRRSILWVGIGACVAFFLFAGVMYARYVDSPAQPDPLSPELVNALGAGTSLVTAFYQYDLGGFIDHEWLWRIDAKPETVALTVSKLGLHRTEAVRQDFWRMPPHYWPRSMPAGGEAFQSPRFPAEGGGQDGTHYFLVHDKIQNQAFVWVIDNF